MAVLPKTDASILFPPCGKVVYYNVYVTDALGTNRAQIDGPLLATADSIALEKHWRRVL